MENMKFLKRLFQEYYKDRQKIFPKVNDMEKREFAFLQWDGNYMIRHLGFNSQDLLINYLINNAPKHMYSSASLYELPEASTMEEKRYIGCDLIFDIDADHLDTSCKEIHDFWECKFCKESGTGTSPKSCPKCGKTGFKKLNWICDVCLRKAKKEIFKLVDDFLEPDLGINKDLCSILFSGHRGYHLHVEDENLRKLSSNERREIVEFITGNNLSLKIFGFSESKGRISSFNQYNYGWPRKIMFKLKKILSLKDNSELKNMLMRYTFPDNLKNIQISTLIEEKEYLIENINYQKNMNWYLTNFGVKTWKDFLLELAKEIGVGIDIPVTIDIHRLIRYPGSLHGSSGFKVVGIEYKNLESFDPFSDPVIFSKKNLIKLEITVPKVPKIRVREITWGPFKMGEILDLPHDIGIFLLCKNVATLK